MVERLDKQWLKLGPAMIETETAMVELLDKQWLKLGLAMVETVSSNG